MSNSAFSHDLILQHATFSSADRREIAKRRKAHTQLGFGYQLAFVRITNLFPVTEPLEIVDELLVYVSVQLNIDIAEIEQYIQRRQTISEHRQAIVSYLNLNTFGDDAIKLLEPYLFNEACRLLATQALLNQAKLFLRNANILHPADSTLRRIIITQRHAARTYIYERISTQLSQPLKAHLDEWLASTAQKRSALFRIKQPPSRPTSKGMVQLAENLSAVEHSGVLSLDLSWLNNNYQRSLARYASRCSADRLMQLLPAHRYATLVCFLRQTYHSTIDHVVDMQHKLLTTIHKRAKQTVDAENRKRRQKLNRALHSFTTLSQILLDDEIADDQLRETAFDKIERDRLAQQSAMVESWLTGIYSDPFHFVQRRFPYVRRFAPAFINAISLQAEDDSAMADLLAAFELLKKLNNAKLRRELPTDAPTDWVPRKWRKFVIVDDKINRAAWECALLTVIRDQIRVGNLYVQDSARFGRLADLFIPETIWQQQRDSFFQQAGLPAHPDEAVTYLTNRLQSAYDRFLAGLPTNQFASIDNGWKLSVDVAEELSASEVENLATLRQWLKTQRRQIRLTDLLIEVDNDLHFSSAFLLPNQQRTPAEICPIIAAIMAHGCNIGIYTMATLTDNVTYPQLERITDWQMTESAQRQALAQVVNAISQLQVTQSWGAGTTSSSDGQRFRFKRNVLQRNWSYRMNDYALEFYSFIADNYAPFYSTVIECNNRDAAFVLDGLLYNESDLTLTEHYTDTHGYTELNFAAFAMLGRRFSPRIRGIQHQRIYYIDDDYDYGELAPLLERKDRRIHLDVVHDQWERIGHFYASLASGHVTASTALKRLVGYNSKNNFYRANRELGRIFKTEHILRYLSDPLVRQKVRRGLLKSEQLHALARQVAYGKQGTIDARDWHGQRNTASCLTLIMACIIYWQAKEISHAIQHGNPDAAGVDLSMLSRISPIRWNNIILYGQYFFDPSLVHP